MPPYTALAAGLLSVDDIMNDVLEYNATVESSKGGEVCLLGGHFSLGAHIRITQGLVVYVQ